MFFSFSSKYKHSERPPLPVTTERCSEPRLATDLLLGSNRVKGGELFMEAWRALITTSANIVTRERQPLSRPSSSRPESVDEHFSDEDSYHV